MPTHWHAAATALLRHSPMAEVLHTRGVKDEQTVTFNPERVAQIGALLERFAEGAFSMYDAMLSAHYDVTGHADASLSETFMSQTSDRTGLV